MLYQTYSDTRAQILNKEVTCVELVKYFTSQIEQKSQLNAFLEVFHTSAMSKAEELDLRLSKGEKVGRLAGCVIAIKDNICYKDHKVTAASKILEGFESLYSATAVEKLVEEDAIIIGRLNCDEFAMGGSNENSAFGPVLNPLNENLVPGGSSGGSSAAVAANLCMIALGSDTGGSIRQPAAFCGVVGLKPTYGRVSRYGLIAYGSSFDQIGPLAHNVEDIALVMEVIAGKDKNDSTSSSKETQAYSELHSSGKLKIAYLKNAVENDKIDSEVSQSMLSFIEQLKKEGHEVEGVDFSLLDYIIPTYYVLTAAEASANLSRYDGARYGYRSPNATDIESTYVKSRSEGFGDEVKRRIMYGNFVLSSGYYDAYYTKAQKIRRLIKEKTDEILKDYDYIVLPTSPTTAFEIGGNIKDPMTMYLQDIFTVHANLSGHPAISLPLFTHSNGMPIGVQVIAKSFDERGLLNFSNDLMSINA